MVMQFKWRRSNIMKKTGFEIPHLSGVAFIQALNRESPQQTNKTCKKKAHEIYTRVRIYSLLTNSSDSFTNLEFRIKEFVQRIFVMISFSTDKLRKKNSFGTIFFQLLHKLRELGKQIGANIWWIHYMRRKNLISKINWFFFRFVPIVYIWLKKLLQTVTTFLSRFNFQKIQFS